MLDKMSVHEEEQQVFDEAIIIIRKLVDIIDVMIYNECGNMEPTYESLLRAERFLDEWERIET